MPVHCNDKVKPFTLLRLLLLLLGTHLPLFSQVPSQARQLILAVAPDWSSPKATLQCWQRDSATEAWQRAFDNPWPVNLGRNGMAWGRGVFSPTNPKVGWKMEKDGKAPAGIFELGPLHGYASRPPQGATWNYLQVGQWDAWIDDPRLPHYNQHVRVDPKEVPPWFESQRMRLGDAAYKWLLEIRHNTRPATPGYGSAIFFHVRRGVDRPTAGCTAMAVENLEAMIRWLRPEKKTYYVLLPRSEYEKVREKWGLP
jgi:L,D-peptidoglycan transpeptidase YkuD (ErfK/YbiS/YcfS/YnhG family)